MRNIFVFIRTHITLICFILLQVFCIAILVRSSRTHEAFFSDKANEFTGSINKQFDNFYAYFRLQEINRQLTKENEQLRNQLKSDLIDSYNSKDVALDSLKTDSSAHLRKYNFLSGRVVGNSVTLQTNFLTIERGSLQGVKRGMSVIGPEGIVGVITEVSENYSRAMSLLHRSSKVSAMLKKDKNTGSIEWDGADASYLTLKNISKSAQLKRGDTVVTSFYSSNFPPNLMIGTISEINVDPATNFYVLKIKTATNFYTLQYVYMVENTRNAEQVKLENMKPKGNE